MKFSNKGWSHLFLVFWGLWIGLAYILFIWKQFPSWFPEHFLPERMDESISPASAPGWPHLLGTDELGRDFLIRLLFGTVYSFNFALSVTTGAYLIGLTVGTVTPFLPRQLKSFVSLLIEIIGALPFLPTALGLSAFYPGNIALVGMVKIFLSWGTLAQMVRLESERLLGSSMLLAAKAQGLSFPRMATYHLVPSLASVARGFLPPLLFSSILSLTVLDFWGLGYPIPFPTLAEGFRQYQDLPSAWWLFFFPLALLIFLLTGIRVLQNQLVLKLPPIAY